jgi:hypothetical protein
MKWTYRSARVRRPIQRAFFKWLAENRQRLAVPIRITERKDRYIQWSFVGVNPILYGFLTGEIGIDVEWKGRTWDYLTFFEVWPQHAAGGYFCNLYNSEARKVFASREALRLDNLFQPFLESVNECLAKARWIGLYQIEDCGSTWAKLLKELPEHEREYDGKGIRVPLFLDVQRGSSVHEAPTEE